MKLSMNSILIFCLLAVMANIGWSDTFFLTGNRQVIGKILEETEDTFLVDTFGNLLEIKKAEIIEHIRSESTAPSAPTPTPTPVDVDIPSSTPPTPTPTEESPFPVIPDVTPTLIPELPLPTIPIDGLIPAATPEFSTQENTLPADLMNLEKPLLPVVLYNGKAYRTLSGVPLFREPDPASPIETNVLTKSTLIGLEEQQPWVRVKNTAGLEGWVYITNIERIKSTPCLVTSNGVKVMEYPGEVYQSVSELRQGAVVLKVDERTIGDGDIWCLVLVKEGVFGWCKKSFLTPLENESLIKPPMATINNTDAGSPILLERSFEEDQIVMTFTLREGRLTLDGLTKLMVLHRNPTLFMNPNLRYMSEALVQHQRLESPQAMRRSGLPEAMAEKYLGVDVLTLTGLRVQNGWQYTVAVPDDPGLDFAFTLQDGEPRGVIILID